MGDDDRFLPLRSPPLKNVGREKATEAAGSVSVARVLFPTFPAGENGTDWNDLARRHGVKAVTRHILAGMPPALPIERPAGSLQPT